MDETFPPCWRCDHPMLEHEVTCAVSLRECPTCGAAACVPFAYPREVAVTLTFGDEQGESDHRRQHS